MTATHSCRGGKPIDDARIGKYEAMYHHLVRKFMPAMALFEASMAYDDLVNQCRYEAFMALRNFDPAKAMTSSIKDPARREAKLAQKRADPEAAIAQSEKCFVYERIKNYLRRTRHNHHPNTLMGRTVRNYYCQLCGSTQRHDRERLKVDGKVVNPRCAKDGMSMREAQDEGALTLSMDMLMEGCAKDSFFAAECRPEPWSLASMAKDSLMETMERDGPEAARAQFETYDRGLREAISEMLAESASPAERQGNQEEERHGNA